MEILTAENQHLLNIIQETLPRFKEQLAREAKEETSPVDEQRVPTDKQIYETGLTNPTVAAAMLRQKQRSQKMQSKE